MKVQSRSGSCFQSVSAFKEGTCWKRWDFVFVHGSNERPVRGVFKETPPDSVSHRLSVNFLEKKPQFSLNLPCLTVESLQFLLFFTPAHGWIGSDTFYANLNSNRNANTWTWFVSDFSQKRQDGSCFFFYLAMTPKISTRKKTHKKKVMTDDPGYEKCNFKRCLRFCANVQHDDTLTAA